MASSWSSISRSRRSSSASLRKRGSFSAADSSTPSFGWPSSPSRISSSSSVDTESVLVIDPSEIDIDPTLRTLVSREQAEQFTIVPISSDGGSLFIAMANLDAETIDCVAHTTKRRVEPAIASEWKVLTAIENLYGAPAPRAQVPTIDLSGCVRDETLARLLPRYTAEHYGVAPVACDGTSLVVAMADPTSQRAHDEVSFTTGLRIVPYFASRSAIIEAVDTIYGRPDPALFVVEEKPSVAGSEELVSVLDLLKEARDRKGGH